MANETYYWHGIVAVPQVSQHRREAVAFAIKNDEAESSGVYYLLNKVEVRPHHQVMGGATAPSFSPFRLERHTALTPYHGNKAAVQCLSDPTGALPDEVQILSGATPSGTIVTLHRKVWCDTTSHLASTPTFLGSPTIPTCTFEPMASMGGEELLGHQGGGTTLQDWTLPEGYGISCRYDGDPDYAVATLAPAIAPYLFEITIRDVTNTQTYVAYVESMASFCGSAAYFTVWNGSGSGVSLAIVSVKRFIKSTDAVDFGLLTVTEYPSTFGGGLDEKSRIERFSRLIAAGDEIEFDAADPSVTVPATLKAYRQTPDDDLIVEQDNGNDFDFMAPESVVNAKQGLFYARMRRNVLRRMGPRARRNFQNTSAGNVLEIDQMGGEVHHGFDFWKYGACGPLILRPDGGGVCLFVGQGNLPTQVMVDLVITKIDGGGGGGGNGPMVRTFA